MCVVDVFFFFFSLSFFFNDTATTEIYTLSLHDALPISMIDIDPQINDKIVKKPKNNLYATGKRKNSIARVWLIPNGNGEIKVNKKDLNKYFSRPLLKTLIKKPFETINNINFNVNEIGRASCRERV